MVTGSRYRAGTPGPYGLKAVLGLILVRLEIGFDGNPYGLCRHLDFEATNKKGAVHLDGLFRYAKSRWDLLVE